MRRRPIDRTRSTGLLFSGFLIVATLYFAREVLIPLALAALIAFLLAPLATRLRRWGLHRKVADLLVAGLALTVLGAMAWLVLGQVYNLAIELPQYQQNITRKVNVLHLDSAGRLAATVQMLAEVNKQISGEKPEEAPTPLPPPPVSRGRHRMTASEQALAAAAEAKNAKPANPVTVRVESPETSLAAVAARDLRTLVQPLTTAFAVGVFVIFMLMARDDLRDRAVRLVGKSHIHIATVAMSDASSRVSRYLLMQFVVNVAYGSIVGLGLWAIGVPHPLLWAVMTACLRFIPYVGILAAGAGPVLVAMAASPNWRMVAWTFGLYVAMELLSANVVEPWLYGASTGVSALAILVAAIFWTWLWGLAGLLLSTPLTVCLIVLGRHVPRLEFLGVLFGEATVLDPPQRLYQRVLASDESDAANLIEEELKAAPFEAVYDRMVIPALSLLEEARHAQDLDEERADSALHCLQEILEAHGSDTSLTIAGPKLPGLACIAVRDFADEIACGMLARLAAGLVDACVVEADLLSSQVVELLESTGPEVLCVVGLPPHALRHVRLRCHQLRSQFPQKTIVACVFSAECDLATLRSRIPLEEAQHVACSVTQALEYLRSLSVAPVPAAPAEVTPEAAEVPVTRVLDVSGLDVMADDVFQQIATHLAKTLEAPMALVSLRGADGARWCAQCGLPDGDGALLEGICAAAAALDGGERGQVYAVSDLQEIADAVGGNLLSERAVRFLAGVQLATRDGDVTGQMLALDTRPRQVTDLQTARLQALGAFTLLALEFRSERVASLQPS